MFRSFALLADQSNYTIEQPRDSEWLRELCGLIGNVLRMSSNESGFYIGGQLTVLLVFSQRINAASSFGHNKIEIELDKTVPWEKQKYRVEWAIAHELGHQVFDRYTWRNYIPLTLARKGYLPEEDCISFCHHSEFRADAFATEMLLNSGYRRCSNGESMTHPASVRRVNALDSGAYHEIMLDNLLKAKKLNQVGRRFDTWKDFVTNKERYNEVQRSIK